MDCPTGGTVVPAARSEGLVVEHLRGETLIYDLDRDEAHYLSPDVAAVFELCDGRTTVAALTDRAAERIGHPVSPETVLEAIELLAERKLLVGGPATEAGVSRREAVRKAALAGAGAAAAAPLIKSIVAPTPAMAQSPAKCTGPGACCQFHEPCESTNNCCSGLVCLNGRCED